MGKVKLTCLFFVYVVQLNLIVCIQILSASLFHSFIDFKVIKECYNHLVRLTEWHHFLFRNIIILLRLQGVVTLILSEIQMYVLEHLTQLGIQTLKS